MDFTPPILHWLLIVFLSACPELLHAKDSIEELGKKTEPKDAKAAADDSKFSLKDIGSSIEEILSSEKPDLSELAYVAARGTAAFLAISKILDENSSSEPNESKKLAQNFLERSHKFWGVASFVGRQTGKSDKNIYEQVSLLMEIYLQEMASSKQLNNEFMSAPIRRDLDALMRVEPFVNELNEVFEKSEKITTKEK
jgi:hypothetical protein